ncbi:hypothetical protein LINPERPRIM_LOCUS21730, partial [Linum perenne]
SISTTAAIVDIQLSALNHEQETHLGLPLCPHLLDPPIFFVEPPSIDPLVVLSTAVISDRVVVRWSAVYASLMLGAVFRMLSMAAALAVVVPVMVVIWITVVVLLAFFGKPRKVLVAEGRKITREIQGFLVKILLKEGNTVAALCAGIEWRGFFSIG